MSELFARHSRKSLYNRAQYLRFFKASIVTCNWWGQRDLLLESCRVGRRAHELLHHGRSQACYHFSGWATFGTWNDELSFAFLSWLLSCKSRNT